MNLKSLMPLLATDMYVLTKSHPRHIDPASKKGHVQTKRTSAADDKYVCLRSGKCCSLGLHVLVKGVKVGV